MAPRSAVDLLRNIPGLYVNTALGEIRNIVYSRGISANSNEAAAGYYYVSLQEDDLPVTNVTFNNYGPDYFYRTDLGLDRLEALRGGTATVTGPNAPGGIFNYISKTGKSAPGFELSTRDGLEGDGRNPYYRAYLYGGGALGQGLYYAFSGFYRQDHGPRDPGYPFDRGGQLKANLLWEYDNGSVQVYAKYLDDHNAWNGFLPAHDFNNPQLASGISQYASLLIPRAPHDFVSTINGSTQHWDGDDLAHNVSTVFGIKNEHRFGEGWTIRNNLKYSFNKSDWNSDALAFPVSLTDPLTNVQLDATAPGTYTYRDLNTGALLAQVNVAGGTRTVVVNNLPNQQILANGVYTQVAYDFRPHVREVMDQFTLSKRFERGSLTWGAFVADSSVHQYGGGAGIGLSPIVDRPDLISITRTTPTGVVQQVTNPAGLAGIGQRFGGTPYQADQLQMSSFGGGDFSFTDQFSFDGAVRYDDMRVKGSNSVAVANPNASNPAYGGLDGNPNTLYENYAVTYVTPFDYRFSLNYLSYSGALTYKFNSEHSVYVRYSSGKKAPDLQFYLGYTTLATLNNVKPVPQQIEQIEAGYHFESRTLRAKATPFYSKLSDVGSAQIGTNPDGTTYFPPTLYSTTRTYGVELEADADLLRVLNLKTALTLQDSRSQGYAIWVFNSPGPQDDTISRVPDGEADNTAKIMSSTTLTYRPFERLTSFLTWRYMGKRAANRYDAFYLPGFHEVDFGALYRVTDHLTVEANINNLFNQFGILGFAPAGTLLGALDRQSLTPAQIQANPNQTFSILPNQPRSYFLTIGYRFE
jgi:outer membrane receptor protein involved in Fe transport